MICKIIAALLLFPSSFIIYDNVLNSMKTQGLKSFFSYVAKKAPSVIYKKKFLYNIFVYYPMRIAVELLRGDLGQIISRKLYERILGLFVTSKGIPDRSIQPDTPPRLNIDVADLCALVEQPSVSVISFDVFDTLLLRPVYNPKDIFLLIAGKVDSKYGIDFFAMRANAEEKLNNDFASLNDIYAGMKLDFELSDAICADLLKEEVECEKALLQPRADVLRVYQHAERAGKRIIATSDMYLPSAVLREILYFHGFTKIANIYVSCEHRARKSSGQLYGHVVNSEGIPGCSIIHIGDNYQSDYCAAIQSGITAIHYPSVIEIVRSRSGNMWQYFDRAAQRDPFVGMLIASSMNFAYGNTENSPASLDNVESLTQFCKIILAPWTVGICLSILNNRNIQDGYEEILFASRDGWLPNKVYEILRSSSGGIAGRYFYAGRRAYLPFMYESLIECAQLFKGVDEPDKYTLEQFLVAHLGKFSEQVLSFCSDEEKNIVFVENKLMALEVLDRLRNQVDSAFSQMRINASKYYGSVFEKKYARYLCFDVGYSGSISYALSAITKKPVDKIYCWETSNNKKFDKHHGTITHALMKDNNFQPYNLILEELFSPLEGSVSGFDENGQPQIEDICCNSPFVSDMNNVSATTLEFAKSFCATFVSYMKFFENIDLDSYLEIVRHLLKDSSLYNSSLFKHIAFSDPIYCAEVPTLAQKIESASTCSTVFSGTGFENDAHILPWPIPDVDGKSKVGIHLHIYNVLLAQECFLYMKQIPFQFDLWITTPWKDHTGVLSTVFSQSALCNADHVSVMSVPNRGRDVAPWIIDFGKVHHQYDFCCHLHTKESNHFDFGARWRRYLFDNLVRSDSAKLAVSVMQHDPQVGCVFPAIFGELKKFMIEHDVSLMGIDGEESLIKTTFKKLALAGIFCRDEIFFSAGTMMWYRPDALHQLFEGFVYEDFPEEPIGVGGTLAHAIERIPPLVALRNGYTVRSLTRYPS